MVHQNPKQIKQQIEEIASDERLQKDLQVVRQIFDIFLPVTNFML
jgi:hypothetical protein